jgi:hypothetical protein
MRFGFGAPQRAGKLAAGQRAEVGDDMPSKLASV